MHRITKEEWDGMSEWDQMVLVTALFQEGAERSDREWTELHGAIVEDLTDDEGEIHDDESLSHAEKIQKLKALRGKKFEESMPGFSSERAATQEQLALFVRDLIAERGLSIAGPWVVEMHRKLVDIGLADPDNRQKHLQSLRFYRAAKLSLKPSREIPKPSNHKRITKSRKTAPTRPSNLIGFPGR
jgi:hypothetical protein